MRHIFGPILCIALTALVIQGCNHPIEPAATTAPTSAPVNTNGPSEADIKQMIADQNKPHPAACSLVTPQEMSTILGSTLAAQANEGTVDKTECIYKPANAPSPYVELTVNYGDGEAAMGAVATSNSVEPGIADPYAGLGDQAVAVGTALMIRTGEDLVTITFSGVEGFPAKARKIFDTAKPRMGR